MSPVSPRPPSSPPPQPWQDLWLPRWQRFSAATVRAFHRYANWLVGISWRRFGLLSILLIALAAIVQQLPPFSWRITETREHVAANEPRPPKPPKAPRPQAVPQEPAMPAPPQPSVIRIEKSGSSASGVRGGFDITIDDKGIRITQKAGGAALPASGASGAMSGAEGSARIDGSGINITLPRAAARRYAPPPLP